MTIIDKLKGKKTYIIAGLMVLVGLVQLLGGDLTLSEFIASNDLRIILEGLGIGFLRAGVAKIQ